MLEGDLGDFTLPDILKLLAFTSKTGRLGIATDGARGRVELVGGRVRDASADADRLPLARRLLGRGLLDGATLQDLLGARDTLPSDQELARVLVERDHVGAGEVAEVLREQTLDALFDLLRWSTGTFRFEAQPPVADGEQRGPTGLAVSVDELLGEAERRMSAWTAIRERTGPGTAVVTVTRPADTAVEVDADGWQLIGLADGHRTVDDLAVLCGRGQFDTRSTLAVLLELGVVSVDADGTRGGVESLLADQALLASLERTLGGAVPDVEAARDARSEVAATEPEALPAFVGQVRVHDVPSQTAERVRVHDVPASPAEAAPADDPANDRELVGAGARLGRRGLRGDRLRPDPTIDADLVSRLIDGVEGL